MWSIPENAIKQLIHNKNARKLIGKRRIVMVSVETQTLDGAWFPVAAADTAADTADDVSESGSEVVNPYVALEELGRQNIRDLRDLEIDVQWELDEAMLNANADGLVDAASEPEESLPSGTAPSTLPSGKPMPIRGRLLPGPTKRR